MSVSPAPCPRKARPRNNNRTRGTLSSLAERAGNMGIERQSALKTPHARATAYIVKPQVESLCKRANELLQVGEPDEAIALLSRAIELDPSYSQSYVTRGAAHALNGHHSAALIDFDTASTKRSYEPSKTNFLQIARSRLLLGSSSAALLAVRQALALDAADAEALLLQSRIVALDGHVAAYHGAVSRNHWHMARSAYESCLGIYAQEDSDAPPSIRCWGIALLVVESAWEDAMKSVNILLREVPDDVDAMNLRALALFLQGKIPEAIEQITTGLKLDPDNARAKVLRTRFKQVSRLKDSGNDLFRQNKWSDAMSLWTDALQLVGEREDEGHGGIMRATLLLNCATANQKLRKFTEGLKDIDESLKLHPKYFKAHLCRARIMIGLEMYETAAEEFRSALELGQGTIKPTDVCGIELELEYAETCAMRERSREQDHYSVLGLSRSCTAVDIKKAYRTLSLKHHPDKGGLAEKFKIIAAAYEVLSDPEQKRVYDAKQRLRASGSGGFGFYPEYDRYQDEYDSDYASYDFRF
ncbi:hypothetical protein C8Q80DRAFT_1220772 [Daedaleopsis nitida]|nr:hypothetical protein C8Q80DRAFT_1220772 [Daedaleopsis nitida]